MPAGRHLTPHKFIGKKGAHRADLTFYARSASEAAAMARDWGRRRGYRMFRARGSEA